MYKIILTGGPCSGKTSILSNLTQTLEERGYKVLTVPEAATILILNGVRPSTNMTMDEFQDFVLTQQIANEDNFVNAAKMLGDKTIIFYDRGILDGCAYADRDTVFKDLLYKRGMTFSDVFNRYDAVLHLVTAADGAEKFYQWNDPTKEDTGNNAARSESPELARIKDKKTLESWIGHPHLRVFDNSTDFEGKIKRVVDEVFALLGEPVPTEVERKFLIKKPTLEQIEALGCISTTPIIQTYLNKGANVAERRVRQRGDKENGFSFYYTEKTDVSVGVRIENERRISKDEYLQLLTEADTSLHQISKIRHCFVYDRRYFEMDMYPFSDEYAILEIELNDINEPINFPPLSLIKEVTDNPRYRNYSLAKTMVLDPRDKINVQETLDLAEEFADNEIAGHAQASADYKPIKYRSEEEIESESKMAEIVKAAGNTNWVYETYRDEPEILGSGSRIEHRIRTDNEDVAFILLKKCGRNTLVREKLLNGKIIKEYWNCYGKCWEKYY